MADDYLAADGLTGSAVTSGSERNATVRAVPGSYACAGRDELHDRWPGTSPRNTWIRSLQPAGSPSGRSASSRLSQNNPAKTTITPYPARQTAVATPVTRDEVRSGLTEQFLFTETMARIQSSGTCWRCVNAGDRPRLPGLSFVVGIGGAGNRALSSPWTSPNLLSPDCH